MPRISSGTMVAALTLAALAAVGVLAAQAAGTAPRAAARGTQSGQPGRPGQSGPPDATTSLPAAGSHPLPSGGTGSGTRVVYSLRQDRVWLVDDAEQVIRTFGVVPGTVDPAPGTYAVVSRTLAGLGGDGVPIEHVLRFTTANGVVIGFSAARDGSLPTAADPAVKTGGIREGRADGDALWQEAPMGTAVVVVA